MRTPEKKLNTLEFVITIQQMRTSFRELQKKKKYILVKLKKYNQKMKWKYPKDNNTLIFTNVQMQMYFH